MPKRDQISIAVSSGGIDIDDGSSAAQSFTPGVTGNLVSIDLTISRFPGNLSLYTFPLVIAIETMDSQIPPRPSGIVLGSTSLSASSVPVDPNFFGIDANLPTTVVFSPSIPLQQGVKYAITLKSFQPLFPNFVFYGVRFKKMSVTTSEIYPDGELFLGSPSFTGTPRESEDIGFVTTMDVDFTPFIDQFNITRTDTVTSLDDVAGTRKIGQTFVPSVTAKLEKIQFSAIKNNIGALGDLNIEIQETTGGLPNGTIIGSVIQAQGKIRPQDFTLTVIPSDVYEVFIPEKPVLTSGTKYAIVFSATHNDVNNYRFFGRGTDNHYSPGSAVQANDGTSWGELPNQDLGFATFMAEEVEITQNINSDAEIAPIGTHTVSSQTQILEIPTRIDNIALAAFSFNNIHRIHAGFSAGQSFTPSITGKLNSVDLVIAENGNAPSDLIISLETIVAGVPDGIPIESVAFSPADLPTSFTSSPPKTTVNFITKPVLTAGIEYVITLKSATPASTSNFYRYFVVTTGFSPDGLMTGGNHFIKFEPGLWSSLTLADGSIVIRMEAQVNPFIDQFQMGRFNFQSSLADLNDELGTAQVGQTFTSSETAALTQIWFSVLKVDSGTLGDMDIEIQETTNGFPNGVVIGSTTIAKSEFATSKSTPVTRATIPQAPLLQKNVLYAVVFKSAPHDASNRYEFENAKNSLDLLYLRGDAVKTEDGINWFKISGSLVDLCFATLMAEVVTNEEIITSDAIVTSTQTKLITSDAFVGEITTQIIFAEGVIQIEREETILTDTFVGETSTQNISIDAKIILIGDQEIFSDAIIFVTNEETIDSNGFIKEPLDFFATIQMDKNIEIDKNIETTVDNDVPSAPTGLIAVDGGNSDTINLTWTATNAFFNIFRKDTGPTFVKVNSLPVQGTSYQVGGQTEGVAVTFIVRGINGLGQESPNSNEATATPTFNKDLERFSSPTYVVKINGTPESTAILEQVRLGFGSNLSTASFSLPRDFRPGGDPAINDDIDVLINSRLVFRGFITTKADALDEGGGFRVIYTCHSTIIELTEKALFEEELDEGITVFNVVKVKADNQVTEGKLRAAQIKGLPNVSSNTSEILFFRNADQILKDLGITNGPTDFPGLIDITDLTTLEAAELVLNKVGNAKLYHDMSTGITSVYNFGSGGFTTRTFNFGKNIISYDVQETELETIDNITVIGAPIQIRKTVRISSFIDTVGKAGRHALQFDLSGKNIRDIQVLGFQKERPVVRFDDNIQVSLNDFGITELGNFSSSFGKEQNSTFKFSKGSEIEVETNSANKTVTFKNKGGSIKKRARSGDTFIDPDTGEKLTVGFDDRGNPTLTGQDTGQRTTTFTGTSNDSSSGNSNFGTSLFDKSRGRAFSFKNTRNFSANDLKLRPIIRSINRYSTERQPIGASLEYRGKDAVRVSLEEIPKIWAPSTKVGRVLKSRVGIQGDPEGLVKVRVLLDYFFTTGPIEVEFTIDADPPKVTAGTGKRCRSITDGQYAILKDSVTGFNNEEDILKRMQTRADGELARLKDPQVSGSITVIGDETIDLRSSVNVNNLKLEVGSVTHSFVNGFTTIVQLTSEKFVQNIVILPLLKEPGVRQSDPREKIRKLFILNFETSELAQASRALASAKEELPKQPQDSGPFARYLE
ncbi:MAG: fibronectin type III domain-containing protein [Deltaproteobacteria bacterium]|nr:MAG: fibronectin type III domain-containing protein [Deltaproteobacteria bacterium]